MERPRTPPRAAAPASRPPQSPPTPEATRKIEENRLRAKALRDQHEAAARAAGISTLPPKTDSGFVATEDIHIVGSRKRPFSAVSSGKGSGLSRSDIPTSNRDARTTPSKEAPLKPAKNFAKFVAYNFSAMTDTKGGFLSTEDDPHNRALTGTGAKQRLLGTEERPQGMSAEEWEKRQVLKRLQQQKAGPYEPGLSVDTRKKCKECGSLEIDMVWEETFGVEVCGRCKERVPEKYSLLTKTEAKTDYLLTDPELRDPELLPHLSKPNPHKSHWHDMMLFLRCQVEEYAFGPDKWGSPEALDAEFEKREGDKRRRKEAKFQDKLRDLKRKTRTDAYRRQTKAGLAATGDAKATKFGERVGGGGGPHVHEWGRALETEDGMSVKTCLGCGMEVQEIEF